jgi:UDP-N-acetylglucosamine--N-acetylmuramyl-(pentapeptide) pyrophosphoryl-undecaprenol N-acetylglucosamine transferase
MTALSTMRILFAGGGTGGHLYPAIAIANRIEELAGDGREVDIHFVGTHRGLEYRLGDRLGYPLHLINVRGLTRAVTLKNLLVPFILVGALISTSRLLSRLSPHVVVGTGGYVSWPVVRQAAKRRIPIILQEQNSYPGMTTRKMARFAREIYLGFDGARSHLDTPAVVTTSGNPVRRGLTVTSRAEACAHFGLEADKKTIAVIGGSQGSRPINDAIAASLLKRPLDDRHQLLWQCGTLDHARLMATLGDRLRDHVLFDFTDRMDMVYAAADLAIARAGALTIAELEACGVPALLIPYPHAAGNHQKMNADEYARSGGARVVDQDRLAGEDILVIAQNMLSDGTTDAMAARLRESQRDESPVDIIARSVLRWAEVTAGTGGISDAPNGRETNS